MLFGAVLNRKHSDSCHVLKRSVIESSLTLLMLSKTHHTYCSLSYSLFTFLSMLLPSLYYLSLLLNLNKQQSYKNEMTSFNMFLSLLKRFNNKGLTCLDTALYAKNIAILLSAQFISVVWREGTASALSNRRR